MNKKKTLRTIITLFLTLVLFVTPTLSTAAVVTNEDDEVKEELTTYVLDTNDAQVMQEKLGQAGTYQLEITNEDEVVPFKIESKGILYYTVARELKDDSDAGYVGFYKDSQGTQELGSSLSLNTYCTKVEGYEDFYIADEMEYFNQAGTYYLKFQKPGNYVVVSYFINGADRTLTDRKTTFAAAAAIGTSSNQYDSQDIYFKYTAKTTGVITTSLDFSDENGTAYITLCDSKKRAMSEEVYISTTGDMKAVFGVYKGRTYYIKVNAYDLNYSIKCSLTAVKEYSGSRKTKPKTIALGKFYKGTILPENSTKSSDWYKFTLTKPTKLSLIVKGNVSSGDIYVTLTSPTIDGYTGCKMYGLGYESTIQLRTTTESYLPKGTYYIRVNKKDKISSGYYAIGLKRN